MKSLYDCVVGPVVEFEDGFGTQRGAERDVEWMRFEAAQHMANSAFEIKKVNTRRQVATEHDIQTDLIIADRVSTKFEQATLRIDPNPSPT